MQEQPRSRQISRYPYEYETMHPSSTVTETAVVMQVAMRRTLTEAAVQGTPSARASPGGGKAGTGAWKPHRGRRYDHLRTGSTMSEARRTNRIVSLRIGK